jgi:putative oxidoreductase
MASPNKTPRWIVVILRLALGAIFIYAAWVKLRLPWQLFAMSIDSYQLLPPGPVEFLARTLPAFELLLGIALIVGVWLRITSAITSALLLVFFSLIVNAAIKGQEISCGCFGPGETISWKTMLRDGAMLAGSLLLTAMAWLRARRSPPSEPASLPLGGTPPEPSPSLPPSESR